MIRKISIYFLNLILFINGSIITENFIKDDVKNPYERDEQFQNNYLISEVKNYFIENKGQLDRSLLFVTDTSYGKIGFMRDGIIHYIVKVEKNSNYEKNNDPYQMVRRDRVEQERIVDFCLVKLTFEGSTVSDVKGEEPVGTSFNYFLGNDSARWASNARGYRSVLYKEVWPGIDIRYYCLDGALKYDIILSPNSDPGKIAIEVEGGIPEKIDENSIMINTPIGSGLIDTGLKTYYSESKELIRSSFYLDGQKIRFDIDRYDNDKMIIIDPHYHLNAINYSTFIGGSSYDSGKMIKYSDSGIAVIVGETFSSNFPIKNGLINNSYAGALDIFCVIIDKIGDIRTITYIGGSDWENPTGIDIDERMNIYLTGSTTSEDFPITTQNFFNKLHIGESSPSHDFFILSLRNNASELYFSSYFGGNKDDFGGEIIFLLNNTIIINANVESEGLPISSNAIFYENQGYFDIYLLIVDIKKVEIIFSTYYGGSLDDMSLSIVCNNNKLIIGGDTYSANFPITYNAYQKQLWSNQDCFLFCINLLNYSIEYSTYIGGSEHEWIFDIDALMDGSVLVCGKTFSKDFPTTKGSFDQTFNENADGFIFKISADGSTLIFSSFIGGFGFEEPNGLSIDNEENFYITGGLFGKRPINSFYITEGALDVSVEDEAEAFFMKINNNCSKILYSTYIGGGNADAAYGISIDEENTLIIIVGETKSIDFPLKNNSYDYTFNGDTDVFVIKFNLTLSPSRPMNLTYVPGESSIDLFWDEPLSDGGSPIDRYRVIRGNTSEKLNIIVGETRERHFTDTSLVNGQRYYYGVQAHNYIDYGTLSDVIMARPGTVPSPPMNFSIDEAGSNIIRLSWEPPLKVGGFDLINYRLFKREGMEGPFDNITIDYRQNYYQDESVINGHLYEYYLKVTNELGESGPTLILNATPKTIPSYIQDLRARSGSGFVLLKWSRPSYDGGSPILDYTITRSDGSEVITKVIVPDNTEHNDTEVLNGKRYYYYVQSRNLAGYSYPSNDVLGLPKGVPDPPRNFELETFSMRLYLRWERPESDGGSALNGYVVYRSTGPGEWERLSETDADTTSYTDIAVVKGNEYWYRVTSFNVLGESEPTPVLSWIPLDSPGVPKGFSGFSGFGFVRLWWMPPDSDGGTPITEHCLYRQISTGTDWDLITLTGTTYSYNDTTVLNGRVYRYRLTCRNAVGESLSTNILECEPGSKPSAPSNIRVEPNDGYVKVSWEYPLEDGGFPIMKITTYRGTIPGIREQLFRTDQSNGTYKDMGLTNGKRYYYSLTAMNKLGESEHSDVIEVTPYGRSTEPLDLRVIERTTSSVKIGWAPPVEDGGSPIHGYIIYRSKGNELEEKIAEVEGNQTEYNDVGLKAGKTYSYSVSAVNGRGEGERSEQLEVTLEKEKGEVRVLLPLIVVTILILVVLLILVYRKTMHRDRDKDEE